MGLVVVARVVVLAGVEEEAGNMNFKEILGVRIDGLSLAEAQQKAREFLPSGQHKIYTPNPEFLVKAQKDENFKKVLNSSDLNLCDGFGLQMASGIKRIPGVDFMIELCEIAAEQGRGVYLLGSGNDEVIHKTAENLLKKFSNLKIAGMDKGPKINENQDGTISVENNETILEKINQTGAEIIFVAFGMGKQEKWIYENLTKLPNIKIAMGVGGAFDYISGVVKRAPSLIRNLGLEWLYRVIKQPSRLVRIYNATIKFLFLSVFK